MKTLTNILLLIMPLTILSQTQTDNFENGYIITLKNDTIKGKVKITNEIDSYYKITFKDLKNKTRVYTADKILEYSYNNNQYISAFYDDKVRFFKTLSYGKSSLYKLLIKKAGTKPQLALYAVPEGKIEDIIELDEQKLKKQLKTIFKSNKELVNSISNKKEIIFNPDTIQKYFTSFNYTQ